MVTYLPGDTDNVSVNGEHMLFRSWLARTDQAIMACADAFEAERRAPSWALSWLWACGFDSAELVLGYVERRPLFDLPPDPSRIIRCARCGRVLTNPVSKALGQGPRCRGTSH